VTIHDLNPLKKTTLFAGLLVGLLFVLSSGSSMLRAEESAAAPAPKPLVDITSPDALKQSKEPRSKLQGILETF